MNAPGFAFRMGRIVLDGTDVTLAVDSGGGILHVDVPPHDGDRIPYIIHDGAILRALDFGLLAHARFLENVQERVRFEEAKSRTTKSFSTGSV